jgi:hypothetical protein
LGEVPELTTVVESDAVVGSAVSMATSVPVNARDAHVRGDIGQHAPHEGRLARAGGAGDPHDGGASLASSFDGVGQHLPLDGTADEEFAAHEASVPDSPDGRNRSTSVLPAIDALLR